MNIHVCLSPKKPILIKKYENNPFIQPSLPRIVSQFHIPFTSSTTQVKTPQGTQVEITRDDKIFGRDDSPNDLNTLLTYITSINAKLFDFHQKITLTSNKPTWLQKLHRNNTLYIYKTSELVITTIRHIIKRIRDEETSR
ncbi:unnamed protein product [Lupinus luteus]|uniref:Uncharacterized protein n=1 Tax=Lupinus luteus TaxID=3873 RepID=A0AAV1X6Z8_LUPLU